jgi:hypothetical protein
MEIYGNDLYSTNTTGIIKSTSTIVEGVITDGTTIIENDNITGLVDPVNLQDLANKNYTDNYVILNPPQLPGGLNGALQYNNGGVFAGTTTINFTTSPGPIGILVSTGIITDGFATWENNILSNLEEPTNSSEISTKYYVDNINNLNISTIDVNQNSIYDASKCINGYIERVGYSGTLIDLTPTAISIIKAIPNAVVGSTSSLSVKNVVGPNSGTNNNSLILIVPNIGITIPDTRESSSSTSIVPQLYVVLYKNYQVNFKIIVTNITPGSEAVTFLTENITFIESDVSSSSSQFISDQFNIMSAKSYFTNILWVPNNFLGRFNPIKIPNDLNVEYSVDNILNKLIIRGSTFTSNKTDTISNASGIINIVPYPFQPASFQLSNPAGLTFMIKNIDPTYSVTLDQGSSIGWTSDFIPNVISTIAPGKTGIFGLSIDRSIISSVPTNTAWIYTIGIV